jgi:DNA polymerase III alpha subunit
MKDIHKYVIDGVVGIADLDNTFGHIPLMKESEKHGFKPIYGVRLRVSREENRKKQTSQEYSTFIAKTDEGLIELYKLVEKAWANFYYFPRLYPEDVEKLHSGIINLGTTYENYYPRPTDRAVYELLAGARKRGDGYNYMFQNKAGPMHIIPQPYDDLAKECNANIRKAEMVKWKGEFNLGDLCKASPKFIDTIEYVSRLEYELDLIEEKGYNDYFMITADMVKWAKRHMFVGPSRGSSAGSLVCYLLDITEVDPIKHNLIFERFIDVNRFDLPDIDVDFPDKKRHEVMDYLIRKYGRNRVRTLGTVNRLMPKSAIGEFAQGLGIPKYETEDVKGAIIERSSGDARAAMCIDDTFETTDPGKRFIEQYPTMRLVGAIEGHAAHGGKHAAGVLVATESLWNYGGVNPRDDTIMMDKKDAEHIGLLKIDCLGLRTLSILEDTVAQIPELTKSDIYDLPLDDEKTFQVFNDMRLDGVFQFEGYALQSLTRQMGVHSFEDIAAITALARPGALNSGGASRYVKYHIGREEEKYHGEIHKELTEDTHGVVIYQEQMMEIARVMGGFSWADVTTLRKAASKSLGDEFFGKFKEKFLNGCEEKGISEDDAVASWDDIAHCGSWIFNKSHAISYGLISYWTAYFKAHYPLEFAIASLNNARDDDHAIKLLRDLVKNEGMEYDPVNPEQSDVHWSVINGKLTGGLVNVKGIGEKRAADFIAMRTGKKKPTPSFWKMMENPETNFDVLFPTQHYWGKLFNDPRSYGLLKAPVAIETIDEPGDYMFVGCLVDRNLRDLNEYTFLKDRDGEIIEDDHLYLNMTVEDDTDSIICTINRWKFEELGGKEIAEAGKVGEDWFLIRGKVQGAWRKINVDSIVNLNTHLGDIT